MEWLKQLLGEENYNKLVANGTIDILKTAMGENEYIQNDPTKIIPKNVFNEKLSIIKTLETQIENYKKQDRVKSIRIGNVQKADIDYIDMKILCLIAKNARFSINDIANELNITTWKINQRYKNLIKNGIIRGFTTNIDISKIGFQPVKIYIHLSEPRFKSSIINYIKFNPFLVCVDETTGDADLELEFYLKNMSSVHDIMQDMSKQFPDIIRSYDFATAVKFYKHVYLPYE